MGSRHGSSHQRVTLWHEGFFEYMRACVPSEFEARAEVPLSSRPRRIDILLLRRREAHGDKREARVLRRLWPRLPAITLLEFKSPSRGFRRSELLRLVSYGYEYHADQLAEISGPGDLSLALVVPTREKALVDEIEHMGWALRPVEGGYAALVGPCYTTYIAFIDEVAEAEHDDYLHIFGRGKVASIEALQWLEHFIVERRNMPNIEQREGYDEMLSKLLSSLSAEERMAGLAPDDLLAKVRAEGLLSRLAPEERMAGLAPEERVGGLTPEETYRVMPIEVLRELSDDFIRSLPASVQAVIRERLAGPHEG
ncbi:hypothetical protein [Haliangium sp.]|uniref:hypothetical protein n=1 Tax=Haliangium sp. TaxID=2663208 RepID=UPI003D117F81